MQCDQLVTIDNCCTPSQCAAPASWHHAESGLALCTAHHANAVKYSFDGSWSVGTKPVSFPAGWAALDDAEVARPSMRVEEETTPSGLVIETGSLSPSGLVIER